MFLYKSQPSPIHGRGIFSLRAFRAGDRMPRTRDYDENYDKVLVNRMINIGPDQETGGFNHSCDPNIDLRTGETDGYLALKDIQPGDELTVSYLKGKNEKLTGCNCQICRK